jgi:hypothetical protein
MQFRTFKSVKRRGEMKATAGAICVPGNGKVARESYIVANRRRGRNERWGMAGEERSDEEGMWGKQEG